MLIVSERPKRSTLQIVCVYARKKNCVIHVLLHVYFFNCNNFLLLSLETEKKFSAHSFGQLKQMHKLATDNKQIQC